MAVSEYRYPPVGLKVVTLEANSGGEATSVMPAGTDIANVTGVANGVTDFVILPPAVVGATIKLFANASNNFEIRTPVGSSATINNVDCDADQEYLVTDTHMVVLACTLANTWNGQSYTKLGAVFTAVIPDA